VLAGVRRIVRVKAGGRSDGLENLSIFISRGRHGWNDPGGPHTTAVPSRLNGHAYTRGFFH
jgi:hypothetical protein